MDTRTVPNSEAARFAWAGLRRFQNVSFVKKLIGTLHQLDKHNARNAIKQATQIRYSLIQAKEYFDAASSVSIATKPNLLYYSIMSLALAEILLKQTGDSSLDRARTQHKHHGLELKVNDISKEIDDLQSASSTLRAVPLVWSGERLGTFELWHRSSRGLPLGGTLIQTYPSQTNLSKFVTLFASPDRRPGLLPDSGVSLFDCLVALPGMLEFLQMQGIASRLVRGSLSATGPAADPKTITYTATIHPSSEESLSDFYNNILCEPSAVNRLEFVELPSGGTIRWSSNAVYGTQHISLPEGAMWTDKEIRFWTKQEEPLNEFGLLYVALYIVGNYARYYPDKWLLDVEKCSPLALAVEELLNVVQRRMPLLAYSEMARVNYVTAT